MNFGFFKDVSQLGSFKVFFRYPVPRVFLSWYTKLTLFLERRTGVSIKAVIPEKLIMYPPEIYEGLEKIELLKEEGIVKYYTNQLAVFPDEPPMKYRWYAETFVDEGTGMNGFGCDFFNENRAFWAMAGEALERYAIKYFNPNSSENRKESSYKDLGYTNKLNIFLLAGLSPEFRERGLKPYRLKYNENTKFSWVLGTSFISGEPIWVPLQLVSFVTANDMSQGKEPVLIDKITTGVAAHSSHDEATLSGILEIFERDAFMIYWLRKITPQIIDLGSIIDERIEYIQNSFRRYNLELYPLYLKTDTPVHIVASLIIDRTGVGPAASIGACAGFDIVETVYKSIQEAHSARISSRINHETKYKNSEKFTPEALGHIERMEYWTDKNLLPHIQFWTSGKVISVDTITLSYEKNLETHEKLNILKNYLKTNKYETSINNILDPRMEKKIGMSVIAVNIPEFQPLHLRESLPNFHGGRLFEVPEKLSLKTGAKINTIPHFFP